MDLVKDQNILFADEVIEKEAQAVIK